MKTIEILCDSHHGVYIPQIMISRLVEAGWVNMPSDALDHVDPHGEWYWENWDNILNNACFTDDEEYTWFLYQDGDLFAVRSDHNFEA